MKKFSVCIPTYEMRGLGHIYLRESLDILSKQTFKDFEVIISDNSINSEIEKVCESYAGKLDIKYFKNSKKLGNSSANINNAIKQASGSIIKILFQDDFLYDANSLEDVLNNFDTQKDRWLVSACEHSPNTQKLNFFRPFHPKYNKLIHLGRNTISSPSVLAILNKEPLLFDENLLWLMDVDYYKRCYNKFGPPKILSSINVVNRVGKHQVSKTSVNFWLKVKELIYVFFKHLII